MAALALMTAACSNDDNDLTTPQPQKAEGITITAQLAPKTDGATTRAVEDKTTYIEAKWAENEHIAILYTVGSTKKVADATITAVDGSGAATITFTVEAGTPDDTPCTLVYPLSAAKDDHTGVKDAATLLAAQNGTLNANLDVRVGEGTIQTATPGLDVTTQPAAQFAIFKFTTKNSDGSATIDVKPLTVTTGGQDYVITPASATSTLYAALPPISSQEVTFTATGSDSKTYTASKASVTFSAGKYYQSNIKLTEQAPAGNTVDLSTLTANYEAQNGDVLTGSTSTYCVTIADGATVTLDGATINGENNGSYSGITCLGDATIILSGANTVKGFYEDYPGIHVPQNKTLTIQGSGSLTASSNGYGCGIGGGYGIACGNIVIAGGTITATGGQTAAGIGSGASASCGTISITGGTITANGGGNAAGIGSGQGGSCGNITITNGVTSLTATKGNMAPYSIGAGGSGNCGTVTIGGTEGAISQSPYTYPEAN